MREPSKSNELYGVHGWLLFLCLVLVIFFPIGVLFELFAVWRRARSTAQPGLGVMLVVAVDVAMLVLAIGAGLLLYRGRRIGVRLAQIFFVLRLLIAVVAAVENQTAEAVLAVVVSAAWLVYLFTSERVRLTYPTQPTSISEIFR